MSPTSPSSIPASLDPGVKEKADGEADPVTHNQGQVDASHGDVDMEDVSELALGMEDWASKQLELLARQLQEQAEQERTDQTGAPQPNEESGGDDPMDMTLTGDDHDTSMLVQSGSTDIFSNTAPEDLMAAIISQAQQGHSIDHEMTLPGSTGGMQDETENIINSFFSSDFLDQLNESTAEQIDLDILGGLGQMQAAGSGMGGGEDHDLSILDEMDEEEQAALLRDLVALSRQPSISPSFEEPGFQLPEAPKGGVGIPLQAQPPAPEGQIVSSIRTLDSVRPPSEPTVDLEKTEVQQRTVASSPRPRTASLPAAAEAKTAKPISALSGLPKDSTPVPARLPPEPVTPISKVSTDPSAPTPMPGIESVKPAIQSAPVEALNDRSSAPGTPASGSPVVRPLVVSSTPGNQAGPQIPAQRPKPQVSAPQKVGPLPSSVRPPMTPGTSVAPRPPPTGPRPRPMPSANRPPTARPSPFISRPHAASSTARPAPRGTSSASPVPRPVPRPTPRPANVSARPALSQRPASGPITSAGARPALTGPPGVRPVSSGAVSSATLNRPPASSPRPPFVGPARPPSTIPRPPGSAATPRPPGSTMTPRPSGPMTLPRPSGPMTLSRPSAPATLLRPAGSTTIPPATVTNQRPPAAGVSPAAPTPRPLGSTFPRVASTGPSSVLPRPTATVGKPEEPEQSHQNKRRRLESGQDAVEGLDAAGFQEFADILSIPIPGMSQINGELLGGSGGEKLSQAQIDEIVASLGRPPTMNDRAAESEAGPSIAPANAAAGPSRLTPECEDQADANKPAVDDEIDELEDDDDPAAQAQELLAMISALLPPGEEDSKDDIGQSEDELDPDTYKMEDSPAPSITDDKTPKPNETPAEKKEKKRRNRLVLNVRKIAQIRKVKLLTLYFRSLDTTVDTEQCDRNIPCARCVKRGVPELCHMEAPFMPNRKNKRKRDDGAFLQAMSEPGFDWNARVRALEDLLRTNPAAFADLDLNGSLVNGVSSLRMPMSNMPTADEQEMQNQVQAVISLINQAQAAQQQLGLDAQQSLSDLGQLVSTGPMLPSAPSMRSSPIPGPTSSVPEPLAVKVKVEENMSVPNSPVRPDRPRSPTRPPSASGVAISEKTSESQPLQPPPGPFRPSVVSPVPRSPSAPVLNRPGISQQVNDLVKADTRPHTPLATPPPAPPAPTNPPPGPSAATPPLPKPNLVSRDEVVGGKSESLPKENGDMQVDTPPAVEGQQPPSEDVDTTGPDAAESQTGGESVVLGPSGNSSDQPIRIDSSPVKAGPLSEAADQPMEAVVPDQPSHPQEKQQPAEVRMDEEPVQVDVTPTPTAVLPAKTSDQSDNIGAPKQEDKPAQLLVPQSRNDSNRNTGTLNIPANLQAELAKLAKGVQDSAFGDDMNDSGMDINMENILGDPSALIAQLASTMGPPAIPPSSVLDDTQNAMLMDMISHLANGGSAAQSTSLPSGLATPTSIPVAAPATDLWSQVPQAIPETNQQVANSFMTDLGHNKLNLGLSGFRQDDGSIFVPPTTRSIERSMHMRGGLSHDALPIEGHAPFLELGLKFAYGKDGHAFKDGRIAAVQAMSLTGALRIGATFLSRFPAASAPKAIYIPNPTVEEEAFAIRDSGLEINLYRFFDRRTGGVDWDGMREDIRNAPEQSIILLHVGGSTPTGAELSTAQWRLITEVIKQRRHIPFCIMEYQGLSSGNVDRDAQPLRTMAHKRIPLVLAQTFDAAMGLYSDSPTIISVVTNVSADKPRIESQLRAISRTMHAHPPPWGAHVVANILGNETVCANWSQEVKAMADRLKSIRDKLFDQLTNRLKTPGNWSHIRKTQGMYCTTLLTPEQLQVLGYREHVHLLPDGCFSLGCLNAAKIEQLARAIDNVIRHPPPVEDDDLAAQAALQIEMALRQGFGLSAGF